MSVRFGLLALLTEGPRYGGQLRGEFEERTGGTWPLNIGQVYTTLDRLRRDGLVELDGPDETSTTYRLTAVGASAVTAWWTDPVITDPPPRSELAIKLALAVSAPGVDVRAVIDAQRAATLTHLQQLTRLKRDADDGDLAWQLVCEHVIFSTEAELRWLDHVEQRVIAARPAVQRRPTDADAARSHASLNRLEQDPAVGVPLSPDLASQSFAPGDLANVKGVARS